MTFMYDIVKTVPPCAVAHCRRSILPLGAVVCSNNALRGRCSGAIFCSCARPSWFWFPAGGDVDNQAA